MLGSVAIITCIYISVDANGGLEGRNAAIWTQIYADHVYWLSVFTIAFVVIGLFAIALFWGTRMQLRFLRYATEPEESRRKLIDRYLKLRSFR